jgi:hypothetical protein
LDLNPELRLMAACCRRPPSPARDAAVRAAAAVPIDWDGFGRLVARHRVEGLVHDGLSGAGIEAPGGLGVRLAAEASAIARRNLAFAAECLRLDRLLEQAGLDRLFLKGVTLNMLAYDTLALKQAVDIDLLVDPARYRAAAETLVAAGYACFIPGPDPDLDAIVAWAKAHKHSNWTSPGGVHLEMHSLLVDNPILLPGIGVGSPRQTVEIMPGRSLPTLGPDELFAYLCAHGAAHGWARLKWLADVAALLSDEEEAEIERLHARSVELGGGRSAGQALLLCDLLFGLALPPRLKRALEGDRAVRLLVRVALRNATLGGLGRELDEMVLGTAGIHLSYLLLDRGARFKLRQLRRTLLGAPSEGAPLVKRVLRPLAFAPRWLLRRARDRRAAVRR